MKQLGSSRLCLGILAMFTMVVLPCVAGEVAVLKNGFSIKHERREVVGDVTRLYVNADGSSFVDVPTSEIEHFEAEPEELVSGSLVSSSDVAKRAKLRATSFASNAFPVPRHRDLSEVVNEASGRYQLDPDLINSVIKAESDFNPHAISPKGAQGLMQLMPGTATQLGVPNAFDPQANVEGGAKYLRELLEKYNFDLVKALAAYNAGPQRVEQFGGVPPYYETRAYVARVVKDFNKKKVAEKSASAKKIGNAKARPPSVAKGKTNSSPASAATGSK